MTAIENYKNLLNTIFGSRTATFNTSNDVTNNVIGALNNPTQFNDFKANFTERLYRLKAIYSTHPDYLKEILVQANLIASTPNWEGAFAELSAFDQLNQDILRHKTYIHNPIKPNITIDKSKTFALELGKHEANLDGFVEDRPLYFDIKCFKDNVNEILQGIYKQLENYFGTSDFHISAEHELDISYDDFKAKRNDLFNELKNGIKPAEKTKYFKSVVVNSLSYRLLWGGGILTAERNYHPYRHAANYHKIIFNNADQFVKDKPLMVIYVVFPWYNSVVTSFSDGNIQLYRSFSRRVFCQYRHDNSKFSTFNSKFTGSHTIYEVSNHISGIIFLEDNIILSKKPNKTNVKSFVYLNPNAKNQFNKSLAWDFLVGLHNTEFDDFEYDNY